MCKIKAFFQIHLNRDCGLNSNKLKDFYAKSIAMTDDRNPILFIIIR